MGRTGQSWGKQGADLSLCDADGQPMAAGMCFVRDMAHILDAIPCYIGFLFRSGGRAATASRQVYMLHGGCCPRAEPRPVGPSPPSRP